MAEDDKLGILEGNVLRFQLSLENIGGIIIVLLTFDRPRSFTPEKKRAAIMLPVRPVSIRKL